MEEQVLKEILEQLKTMNSTFNRGGNATYGIRDDIFGSESFSNRIFMGFDKVFKTRKGREADEAKRRRYEEKYGEGSKKAVDKSMREDAVRQGKAKAQIANSVISGVSAVTQAVIGGWKTLYTYNIAQQKLQTEAQKINLDKQSKLWEANVAKMKAQITGTMNAGISILTKTAADAAYESAKNMGDVAKANIKTKMNIGLVEARASVEMSKNALELRKAEMAKTEGMVDGVFGALNGVMGAVGAFVPAVAVISTAVSAIGSATTGIIKASNEKEKMEAENEILRAETQNKAREFAQQQVQDTIEQFEGMVKPLTDFFHSVDGTIGKFDTASRQLSVTIGYIGNQGNEFAAKYRAMSSDIAATFGKSVHDMQRVTSDYQSALGRNVNMNKSDFNAIFSTERLFGISSSESASIFGGMGIFNQSIDTGNDMMKDMYHTLTKIGLSTKQFGKDLANNIKQSEKYNFKNGIKGVMEMTKWANQLKFNLSSTFSFAEKLMGGEFADGLETSARLQALGGSAAMYADPFGMMFDAYNSMEDLAERQMHMFDDINGTYNSKTGELSFNTYEEKRIRDIASVLGMSPEDVKNTKRIQNRRGTIRDIFNRNGNNNDELIDAFNNRAMFDRNRNEFVVKGINGKDYTVKDLISNPELVREFMPENNDEAMIDVARKSLGVQEKMEANMESINMMFAAKFFGNWVSENKKRMDIQNQTYKDNAARLQIAYEADAKHQTDMMEVVRDNFGKILGDDGLKALSTYYNIVKDNAIFDGETFSNMSSKLEAIDKNVELFMLQTIRANFEDAKFNEKDAAALIANGGVVNRDRDGNYSIKDKYGISYNLDESGTNLAKITQKKQRNKMALQHLANMSPNQNSPYRTPSLELYNYNYDREYMDANTVVELSDGKFAYGALDDDKKPYMKDRYRRYYYVGKDAVRAYNNKLPYILTYGSDGKPKALPGATDGSVKLNDGFVRGHIGGGMAMSAEPISYSVAPDDKGLTDGNNVMYARKGGPVDAIVNYVLPWLAQMKKGATSGNNSMDVNLNGRLMLDCNGENVDFIQLLKTDPSLKYEMARILNDAIRREYK